MYTKIYCLTLVCLKKAFDVRSLEGRLDITRPLISWLHVTQDSCGCCVTAKKVTFSILFSPISPQFTLFAQAIVMEFSLEYADLPRVFHNNSLCKFWGQIRVYYGELRNRECSRSRKQTQHLLKSL